MRRLSLSLAVVVTATTAVGGIGVQGASGADPGPEQRDVPIQLLAMNDFHGRISLTAGGDSELVTDPGPDGVWGPDANGVSDDVVTEVGGSANVAATVQRLQAAFRQEFCGS